jgi:amino acid transporter
MAAQSDGSAGLARGAIGLREVLFQSITSMAPAGAVALSIAAGAGYTSGALPLAVLLAMVACLLVASSIGQLAKHLPSAGSIYTYPSAAIHPALGFLVGWGYTLIEALVGPVALLLLGYLFGTVFHSEWNWPYTGTWVGFMIAAAVAIAVMNYRGVKFSAKSGTVLGAIEIGVFVVLAIWLVIKAGSSNTLSVFTFHFATVKGYKGFSGIAAGSVYTILAFIGFEASAPLAEEVRDPRQTIKRAVIASCLAIGIFYVFTTYAGDVFFGPGRYGSIGSLGGATGSPWVGMAKDVWGIGWVIAFIAIQNSSFANANAGTLSTTRTWYAMSRVGVLPRPLSSVHPRWQSPHVGVLVQMVVTLAIGVPLGLKYGPVTAFALLATVLTGIMVLIYMVFNLSCTVYYLRFRRGEFNILLHGIVPVLGIAAFVPAWLSAMGIGAGLLSFISPLVYPSSLAGPVIIAWYVVGVVVLAYLWKKRPERLPLMTEVLAEEPAPMEAEAVTG